jgi:multidrug efflux system membrane fusion protein
MRRRWAWWLGAAVVVALAALVLVHRSRVARAGRTTSEVAGAGGAAGQTGAPGAASRPAPVVVGEVSRRDVSIYVEGLGSVVANRTVTVRTQVDGMLESVAFNEGQLVHRGDALAQIDPRPFQAQLDQAQGALVRDQAQLRTARINEKRSETLVAQKLIAQQQLDSDRATAGQLEGAVRIDLAAIETAKLNLSYARITSPTDGVTGIRVVDPGNLVHTTDTGGIVVVTQLEPVGVIFSLPQDYLPEISKQLAAGPLQVEALSRDTAAPLGVGTLAAVDNLINQSTSTLRLKATLPNSKHLLWPNQFVNARLRLEVRRGALTMPVSAVQRGPNGSFAWVVNADDSVAERPVQLDRTQGELALVTSGVREGERVVVEGQGQLRAGAKVAARAAEPAPGPGRTASPVARDGGGRTGTGSTAP